MIRKRLLALRNPLRPAALAALGLARQSPLHTTTTGRQPAQIAFAEEVSNLMLNELVAALFKEFDETTPQNVEHGKQAISLIFNDTNRDMRLIGSFGPLQGGANDRPGDRLRPRHSAGARR